MKKDKKFIALFLAFSLMMLSVNLYAKERRGVKLIVTKKNGQLIEGELITVKPNSLLLLNTEGKDVSVGIADIKVIRIVKKSQVGNGFLLGGSVGALIGLAAYREPTGGMFTIDLGPGATALGGGIVGGLIGLVIGLVAGTDKTIHIEGMSDSEIQEALEKLRKKARIRDYK
jgi:hypothetical protein